MAQLKLFLFGPPRLERADRPVKINRRKMMALLIYLAVNRQPHSRDALATLLWPNSGQRTGRANLRRTLYRLGQAVEEELLSVEPETVCLNPQVGLWLDVDTFQQHVADCLPPHHPADELRPNCLSRLTTAAELYTNDFLAGFTLADSPDFDEWQFFQAESLRQSLAHVLEQLVHTHQTQAQFEEAIHHARRWLALDPLHEPVHRHLMQLCAWCGQQAAALRQYQECVRIFDEEFGLPPEPETTQLFEAIKAKRLPAPAAATRQARKKAEAGQVKHNLSPQPTPFIGREAELAALAELLANADTRLITIVGAGGMGKTRLALAVAEQQLSRMQAAGPIAPPGPFADGIFFVSLASLNSADRIIPALAGALSFQLDSNSRQARSPRQQILDYLRHKHLLLILDNFEHLLDGLDAVTDILQAAPGIKILATSRERLNLHEEHVFSIEGLPYPPEDSPPVSAAAGEGEAPGAGAEAVQLFVQSAQRTRPDFTVTATEWPQVARICRLVEGMPLGVELAASWVNILPLADIAAEIQHSLDFLETEVRNIPHRHRSIRAVFDASWQRMDPPERKTFARLSIFRGGFNRAAAQQITGASLRTLAKLAGQSLLQYNREQDRYQMHELLRQYGVEKLAISLNQEMALWQRYSTYFCGVLGRLEAGLKGPQQQAALAKIGVDEENILTAWQWAASQGQIEQLAQAMNSLGLFLEWQARFRDGENLFQTTVRLLEQVVPAIRSDAAAILVLARALTWQCTFARLMGNNRQAEQLAQQGLQWLENDTLARDDDPVRAARAAILAQLGHLALNTDTTAAQQWYRQSLALYRALGAEWEMAYLLDALSELFQALGNYEKATDTAQQSLALQKNLGDPRGMARSLAHLSLAARHKGQSEDAVRFARQSYAAYQALGHRADIADGLHNLGMTLTYVGDFAEAQAALEKSIALYADLGNRLNLPMAYARAAIVAMSLGEYDKARRHAQTATELGREVNDRGAVALALTFTGWLHLVDRAYPQAQEQLQESLAIFQSIGRQTEMGMTLALLGGTYRGLGNRQKAQQLLLQALQQASEHQNFLPLTAGLHLAALMLMEQAETVPQPAGRRCQQWALWLYALGNRYPTIGNACEVRDIAGRYLEPMMAALPPDFVEENLARGKKLTLWTTISELLDELPTLGWASNS